VHYIAGISVCVRRLSTDECFVYGGNASKNHADHDRDDYAILFRRAGLKMAWPQFPEAFAQAGK